jgi:hypothetical protein
VGKQAEKKKGKKLDDKETRGLKKKLMEELSKTMDQMALGDRSGVSMLGFQIAEEEYDFAEKFLEKFTVISESSAQGHIDIMLMLKALPNKVTQYQLSYALMFSFRTFQESLVAYQNQTMVSAFEYFDEKNRERIQLVKERVAAQKHGLSDIRDILELCKLKIIKEEEEAYSKIENRKKKLLQGNTRKIGIMKKIHGDGNVDSQGNLIVKKDEDDEEEEGEQEQEEVPHPPQNYGGGVVGGGFAGAGAGMNPSGSDYSGGMGANNYSNGFGQGAGGAFGNQ